MQEIPYKTCERILKEVQENIKQTKDKDRQDVVEFLKEMDAESENDDALKSGLAGYTQDLIEFLYCGVNEIKVTTPYIIENYKIRIFNKVDARLAISITGHTAECAHRPIDTGYPMDPKEYDDIIARYAASALIMRKTFMTEFMIAWEILVNMRIAQILEIKGE